jgi:hypothetical protein
MDDKMTVVDLMVMMRMMRNDGDENKNEGLWS